MLPTNFDTLAAEYPKVRPALVELRHWIRSHPDWDIIEPRKIAADVREIDTVALAYALHLLVRHGFFRQVYMVETPSGVLADARYEDPGQIPKNLPDRFNRYFETAEADIVPVLVPAK